MELLSLKRPRIFYGWWIAFAGLLINFYLAGTFWYGFSAFFQPLTDEFGWTRAAISVAFSIQSSEAAVLGPFAGFAIDRFGPRGIMIFGITMSVIGFFLLSFANSIWTFYGAYAVVSLGLSFGSWLAISTAINNWFDQKKGRAFAIMTLGAGLGGMLTPLVVILIDVVGWRVALQLIGAGLMLVGYPTAAMVRRDPEPYGFLPDGVPLGDSAQEECDDIDPSLGDILRSRAFWQIGFAVAFGFFIVNAIIAHQIPALESFGVSRGSAGFVITIMTLASLAGRWIGGTTADYWDKRKVLVVAFIMQFVGLIIFVNIRVFWHAVVFALIFGPGFGASIPTRPALQGEYFGRQSFGSLMGILYSMTGIGGATGPVLAGWMFDTWGSYRMALFLMALPMLASILLFGLLKKPDWSQER
ncbi:MAG: MFS transporter [SAR202 cluster bacterium]|nr:MFS transporter [SAR202 cluster bacterium]